MKKHGGIWIDHRKALVVVLDGPGEHVTVIDSEVEKHPERAGDSPLHGSYEAAQVPPDDRRQRALTGELNVYYEAVIASLRDVERFLVCGPGEAKGELVKRLQKHKLDGRVAAVQAADKMTDRQLVAHVREFYSGPRVAQAPEVGRPNAGLRGRSPSEG